MYLRILFSLLILNGALSSKAQLLDSTLVASLSETSPDSIFICKKDYPNFSKWYLCVKQKTGYDTLLLNDPFDAMGIESMEIYPVEMHKQSGRLIRIESATFREHSYGGTGGWAYLRNDLMMYDLKTKKMVFDGFFIENLSQWTSSIDSTGEGEDDYTETTCGFSYSYEIDSLGNITFFNYDQTENGCSALPEISAGTYLFKKGEYILKKED